ncbi:MAG: Ig-like domain-containing protein [Nitrososphaerales archaeon]
MKTPPSAPTGIALSAIPTRLPADGNTYPALLVTLTDQAGNPSLALNTTVVFLTSSQENVATVPSSVTIPGGQGYFVANITTTETPGTSTITASAAGKTYSQVVVATAIPSGYATHLRISPQPADVFARPGGFGSLVIQLQDQTGLPAKAAFNVNVSLSSSNTGIAQLGSKSVIVPTGEDLAVVNYTSGYAIGQAFVTATASGFSAGTTSVGVIGSPPYSLRISAEPDEAVVSGNGKVVVWLTDPSGNPARAPSPVTVTLTSSNLTVASVSPTTVTIATGQISAVADFTDTSHNGTVMFSASAQGLLSGFSKITTYGAKHNPAALEVFAAPNPVLADNGEYTAILVAVVDATSARPDVVSANTAVTITSSDTAVGSVLASVTIPAGQEYAVANITSTYLVGSTVITASAQGLQSGQAQESAFGPIPVSVVVTPVADTISADGGTYRALTVSLQDAFGNPAVAPSDIIVQLASSRSDIATVTSPVIIQTGQTYAFATVKTGLSPGATNITASASGYGATSALLTTAVPAPDRLALYVGPNATVSSSRTPDAVLTVQLQDIDGLPARAQEATTVTVTASNATFLSTPIVLRIPAGADFATTRITMNNTGLVGITASAPGLGASSLTLNVVNSPVTETISAQSTFIAVGGTTTVLVTLKALGQGIQGAQVQWSTNLGQLSAPNSTTNANGVAFVGLQSSTPGIAYVRALITSPFTAPKNFSTSIVVNPIPPPVKKSFEQEIQPYLIYIVILIVVVVAVLVFFFFRRWRRTKVKAASEAEETQPYDELEEIPGGDQPVEEGGPDGGPGGTEGSPSTEALGRSYLVGHLVSICSSLHMDKVL